MTRQTLFLTVLPLVRSGQIAAQGPPDTLRFADAIAEARATNPALAAARIGADAALQRILQAGA